MPTANFTLPPNELIAQLQAQALRQKEAESDWDLVRRPTPPAQLMDTGAYKIPDFATPLIQAMTRAKVEEQVKAERARSLDLSGKYQQQMAAAMQAYLSGKRPSSVELPGPTEDGGPLKGTVQPNLGQVDEQALTSPFPEVQKMAQESLKRRDTHFGELLKKASVASGVDALQAGGDFGKLRAKDDSMVVDGAIFNKPEHGTPTMVPGGGYRQETLPDGSRVNVNRLTNHMTGTSGQTINVGQKADAVSASKLAENLQTQGAQYATTIYPALSGLEQAERAAKAGAFQGAGSDWVAKLASFAGMVGLAPDKWKALASNSELINSSMGNRVLMVLKATGYNPSQMDLVFSRLMAGSSENTPEGLAKLIQAARASTLNEVELHNRKVDAVSQEIPSVKYAKVDVPERYVLPKGWTKNSRGLWELEEETPTAAPRGSAAPASAAPTPVRPSISEQALRSAATLTPQEQQRDLRRNARPANIQELQAEIAKYPVGSEQRLVLERELRKIQAENLSDQDLVNLYRRK